MPLIRRTGSQMPRRGPRGTVRAALLPALFAPLPAAATEGIADKYPGSPLYNKPVELFPGVWTSVGATDRPTPGNGGHVLNLSFIITGDGVVVVNAGAAYILAEALHDEIRARTDQPVRMVINTGADAAAMLGNSYWIAQGVPVLAHSDAAYTFDLHKTGLTEAMAAVTGEAAGGTFPLPPTETFTDRIDMVMGDFHIEIVNLGPARAAGDVQVWLPEIGLVIAGGIALHERLPEVAPGTCTACWIETWDAEFEPLGATWVIPAHGHPASMAQVRRYSRDYLAWLRDRVGEHIDAGGDAEGAREIDQSPWARLDLFGVLAAQNAVNVFTEMEFDR